MDISNDKPAFIETSIAKPIICTFYGCIFFLGICGNVLVIVVVLIKKKMQTITNIFITNLAVSDIFMCLISVPFTPMVYFVTNWNFSISLCKILIMTMGVTVHVSTLTSTAIALNRFLVIKHPLLPRMQPNVCSLTIITIWTTSVLYSLPLAIFENIDKTKYNVTKCKESWPKHSSKEIFAFFNFLTQFIIPSIVITYCYMNISKVLNARCKNRLRFSQKSRFKEEMEIHRKKRTNNMLIIAVVIFSICWIPLNVLLLSFDIIKPNKNEIPHFRLVFFICHILAMTSAIYNPFIYGWLNENFKKEFSNFFKCLFLQNQPKSTNLSIRPRSGKIMNYDLINENNLENNNSLNEFTKSVQCSSPNLLPENNGRFPIIFLNNLRSHENSTSSS